MQMPVLLKEQPNRFFSELMHISALINTCPATRIDGTLVDNNITEGFNIAKVPDDKIARDEAHRLSLPRDVRPGGCYSRWGRIS